jgi:hypothetical protein
MILNNGAILTAGNPASVTTLSATGAVTLTANTASTNTTTGTLVVTGGVGISGAVNAGGALSITGALSGVTTIGASDRLTITRAAGTTVASIVLAGTGTAGHTVAITNTGGDLRLALEGSVAGISLSGSLAYASYISSVSATALQFATSDTVRQTIFSNGNVAIGTTTDNTAKLQVVGNFTATQVFAVGDSGAGVSSTVAITNVTTESISSGVCTILSTGATARSSTGWLKIYSGTGVRYIPYFTTISG